MKEEKKFTAKDEWNLVKWLIIHIHKQLDKEHPKLKRIDSNLIHFIVHEIAEKCKLPITRGWFKHGPYYVTVDDVLIKDFGMDKSQHQIYGNEKIMEKFIECDCHKNGGERK